MQANSYYYNSLEEIDPCKYQMTKTEMNIACSIMNLKIDFQIEKRIDFDVIIW